MDTCGFPKDNFYYYQSWWSDKTVLHLLPHWNWPGQEGRNIDVRCLSNCEEVELFLNGVSLGKKAMPRNSHLQWSVPYAPGALSAKGYKAGQVIAEEKVETTGAPASVKLTPDRPAINADGEDLGIITVAVTDAQGRVVPVAGNLVHFEISGGGRIIGVGNGDPSCHEPDDCLSDASSNANRAVALSDWRMKLVPDAKDRPEIAGNFSDADWARVDVNTESGPLQPNTSAVFRGHVVVSAENLAAGNVLVQFGMIDDEGWVYVNGQPAGESHNWADSPSFDIGKLLHAGDNVIAVAVRNIDGSGGINKGVNLYVQNHTVAANWQRSVFNGLAQVIVQAGKDASEIRLTARSEGLAENTVVIPTKASPPRATVPE